MTQEAWMIYSDVEGNNNKFWKIHQDGCQVTTQWGRVGDNPQEKTWNFDNVDKASKEFSSKCRSKEKKGYSRVKILNNGFVQSNLSLSSIVLRDFQTENSTVQELIKYLTDVNIHQILENTTISFDKHAGVFTTSLGVVVDRSTIDEARTVLMSIQNHIKQGDYIGEEIKKLTNQYLRLIPQDLGRAANKLNVERIWRGPLNDALLRVKQQGDILDSLEVSIKTVLQTPQTDKSPEKLFRCQLHLVEDGGIIDVVKKQYELTANTVHESRSYKFDKLYQVDIEDMRRSWEEDGAKVPNIRRLWHGTKPSNVLSILKQGLIIPSSAANGRMFGDGLYFADQSTKSLNYSCGYWGGGRSDRCFMFQADVALGRPYIPPAYNRSLKYPQPGYDSTHAQGGKSGVYHDEFIVYKTSRANLVYLIEFKQ